MAHGAKTVFYADGEQTSTRCVHEAIRQLGARIIHFDVPLDCVASLKTEECDLLISNSAEPGVEGMELLTETRRVAPEAPVILLVDHGDIQTAVRAMKAGAADCLERPPEIRHLLLTFDTILHRSADDSPLLRSPLSRAEVQVLHLVLQGHTNSEMGQMLHRSRRTIEVHRSNIMRKLRANDIVELVKTCARAGLLQDWP
jgi:FixJ family two-component response regulator